MPEFDEASDHILVRVIASSLNPIDLLIIKGTIRIVKDFPMPTRLGYDLSGVVEKVGSKVTRFKPGDDVIGTPTPAPNKGSMAEYISLSETSCGRKPKALSHVEAACLPIAGLTAVAALRCHEGAKDVALVPAGMGGVGSIGIQLAKNAFGFKKVITTVSTSKVPLIKTAIPNVDQVIDYKTTKIESVVPDNSVDFVLDTIGKPKEFVRFMNTSRPDGSKPTIASVATGLDRKHMQEWWDVKMSYFVWSVMGLMNWNVTRGIPSSVKFEGVLKPQVDVRDLELMAAEADRGMLKPIVAKVFPLNQAVQAFETIEAGKVHGKVVLRIAAEP